MVGHEPRACGRLSEGRNDVHFQTGLFAAATTSHMLYGNSYREKTPVAVAVLFAV